MSALISFFGGSVFRMVWGEVSAYFTRRQEAAQQLELLKLQETISAAQHERNLAGIKLQAELGVKTIEVQRDADVARAETDAWLDAVKSIGRPTGIAFVDTWNGVIRPLLATLAILAVVGQVAAHGFDLTEWDQNLIGAILGIYVADRSLTRRGK